MSEAAPVVVVGGGLAGITAAVGCADAGREVTLLESRDRLGGLTHSFRRGDLWVDNGQHVFLRCCTSYRRLLSRLGVADLVTLQDHLDVPVTSGATGRTSHLRRTGLSAPLHLAGALARYRWLSPRERLLAAGAALALRRVDPEDPAVDERSFGVWLARHAQSDRAVEALWDLVGIATLNARARNASLALAATVFRTGLLDATDAADIGWPLVPLQRLHGDAAQAALRGAGVRVLTSTRATGLVGEAGRWTVHAAGRSTSSVELPAGDVVLAAPARVTESLLPAYALGTNAGWSDRLGSSPILNVHLRLDRRVLSQPFIATVDSPLQWIFDRTQQSGMDPARGQYLAISLSAAEDLLRAPVSAIRDWTLPHLHHVLPGTRAARLEDFFVTREPHATFSPRPGSSRWRPGTNTNAPGLHLAGAWTATGWPATMEGAVRSGESAVSSVLTGSPRPELEVLA